MAKVDYWGIKQAIKSQLDLHLASQPIIPQITVEEEVVAREAWVGIFQDGRQAPDDFQTIAAGKRTRFLIMHRLWVWRYALKPADAIRLRDYLLGSVEIGLMLDRTFANAVRMSWIQGGRMVAADAPDQRGLWFAGAEIELVCAADCWRT
jgi:hypothetical protein